MKKLLKVLAWVAGIVVVLIIAAIVVFRLFYQDEAKAYAVEKGSAALNRPLTIESIDLSFWGGLGLNLGNVTVGNPAEFGTGNFLTADNVDLKLEFWPLLKKQLSLDRLIIDKPTIIMNKRADGTNNFTFAAVDSMALADSVLTPRQVEEMTPEAKTAAVAISFNRLEINDAHLEYVDDSSTFKLVLDAFDLNTTLKNPERTRYVSAGKAHAGQLQVTTDKPMPAFEVDLSYAATYDVEKDDLKIDRAGLTVNKLQFELAGQVAGLMSDMKGRVTVKSDGITVADLFSMMSAEQSKMIADYKINGGFSLDAQLDYDAARGDKALAYTGTAVISGMSMSKKDIDGELKLGRALLDFKPDNLRVTIDEGSFAGKPLKGYLTVNNFDAPAVGGELTGSFDLAFAQPFMPPEDKHELAGVADFDVKFNGLIDDVKGMTFSGDFSIPSGRYKSNLVPEPIDSLAVDMHFDSKSVIVKKFFGKFPSGSLAFDGRITDLVPYLMADSIQAAKISLTIDGHLKGDLDLASLDRFLPKNGNPELTGRLALDVSVTGRSDDLTTIKPRGNLSVTGATYNDSLLPEPIESLTLRVAITPDTIDVKQFTVKFTSSDVTFDGRLVRPFPYLLPLESIDRSTLKKPMFYFTLSSHRFDTDKLFPEAVPGSGAKLPEGEGAIDSVSVSAVLMPDIDGQGNVVFDTLVYSKVEFTKITAKAKIKDRKIYCTEARADVYTGEVTGEATIDLNDFDHPRYLGKFTARQIEADDFVSRFSKFGGHVFGKLDLSGTYDAVGWEPDSLLNSLTLDGLADVRDGKLITSGAVETLLSNLAERTGQTFNKEQALKNLTTKLSVKDGKVILDDLKTRLGDIGDLTIGGYYGFDDAISYTGSLLLTQETSQKLASQGGVLGGLANLLGDSKTQRITIPLKISGTLTKPNPEIDMSVMQQKAVDNLKGDATNLLQDLFNKKKK